jgi:hypothetical protein
MIEIGQEQENIATAISVISLHFSVTICIFITAKEFGRRFTMLSLQR